MISVVPLLSVLALPVLIALGLIADEARAIPALSTAGATGTGGSGGDFRRAWRRALSAREADKRRGRHRRRPRDVNDGRGFRK